MALLAVLALGAMLGWAIRTVALPQETAAEQLTSTLATVEQGTVGRSIRIDTSAEWPPTAQTGQNAAAGTVTSVEVASGDEITAGQLLYTVDLAPVVVAQGDIPMFRDLREGDTGGDVEQLQSMLEAGGHLVRPFEADLGPATQTAVAEWRTAMNAPSPAGAQEGASASDEAASAGESVEDAESGDIGELDREPPVVVGRGEIIFVDTLPARIQIQGEGPADPGQAQGLPAPSTPAITVGSAVSGGETAFTMLAEDPEFSMTLTEAQAGLILPDARVEIDAPGGTWEASLGELTPSEGGFRAALGAVDGGSDPLCGEACTEAVPMTGSIFPSRVTVVPETSGLVVPTSSVRSLADGSFVVVLADQGGDDAEETDTDEQPGLQRPVTVIASADGQSIITGVHAGDRVLVPAP